MNKELLHEIYRRYYRKLYCYALSLCRNRADAQDLVSDAFIKALLFYSGNGSVEAWLYRVLKNQYIDEYRRRKHFAAADPQYIESIAAIQSSDAAEQERLRWMYEQILQMKHPDREIMLLTAASDLNDSQIAEITGVTAENLRVIRHRAKEKLKEQARKEEI